MAFAGGLLGFGVGVIGCAILFPWGILPIIAGVGGALVGAMVVASIYGAAEIISCLWDEGGKE